jgi:hypothetical protein
MSRSRDETFGTRMMRLGALLREPAGGGTDGAHGLCVRGDPGDLDAALMHAVEALLDDPAMVECVPVGVVARPSGGFVALRRCDLAEFVARYVAVWASGGAEWAGLERRIRRAYRRLHGLPPPTADEAVPAEERHAAGIGEGSDGDGEGPDA